MSGTRGLVQDLGRALGTYPRFQIMKVLLNSITVVPCWLTPVVFTVTMPTFGRDFDSRFDSTRSSRKRCPRQTARLQIDEIWARSR